MSLCVRVFVCLCQNYILVACRSIFKAGTGVRYEFNPEGDCACALTQELCKGWFDGKCLSARGGEGSKPQSPRQCLSCRKQKYAHEMMFIIIYICQSGHFFDGSWDDPKLLRKTVDDKTRE